MFLSAISFVTATILGINQTATPEALAATIFKGEIQKEKDNNVLCIEVDGKDAHHSLLAAIQTKNRTIVLGSECERVMDTSKGSYHKRTGRPALFMSVGNFHPTSSEGAEVDLNLYRHGLWAVFKTLEVRKSGKTWVVVATKRHTEA